MNAQRNAVFCARRFDRNPIDLLNSIAPTEPPGFLGVPEGEPTVPNLNDKVMETPGIRN